MPRGMAGALFKGRLTQIKVGYLQKLAFTSISTYYRTTITMDNTITRGVFLAFVRVHVLHHAAEGPVFGLEMIEELRHHGYSLGPGTLYPILHNLEKSGCLRSKEQIVRGKRRKNYVATAKGKRTLEELRKKIREMVREVLK
jgi:DNA-binding PadR family transcriptional regulator